MKIIDAVWEKRNIGVECKECSIDTNDDFDMIQKAINELGETEYSVVRIPSGRVDAAMQFQEHGYQFIEVAIKLEIDLNRMTVPERIKNINKKISWELMDENDLQVLYSEIDKNIFKTDRVILDPYFNPVLAAQRYKFWTMDLIEQGCIPYKVRFNGDTIGFFINKEIKPGIYDGLLAGVYDDYNGSGMGICVQYAGLEYARSQSAKKYIGHVSSNNSVVLKSLEMLGFRFKMMEYIFIKHN